MRQSYTVRQLNFHTRMSEMGLQTNKLRRACGGQLLARKWKLAEPMNPAEMGRKWVEVGRCAVLWQDMCRFVARYVPFCGKAYNEIY